MGKPFFGDFNEAIVPTNNWSARTEDPAYPVANIGIKRIVPGYHSADRALSFNGVDEFASVAAHADFQFTTSCEIEFVFTPDNITGNHPIVEQGSSLGGSVGWAVWRAGANLLIQLPSGVVGNNWEGTTVGQLVIGKPIHVKCIYDGSGTPSAEIWTDGDQAPTATTGAIPASLTVSGNPLSIMRDQGANYNSGTLSFLGGRVGTGANAAWLNPSACAFYYEFENDLTDSSGNGHNLTGTGIDTTNFSDYTGWQYLSLGHPAGDFVPDKLVIGHNHNMQSGATVDVWNSTATATGRVKKGSAVVVAGKPVVVDIAPFSNNTWSFEINDPDNPAGFIDISHLYLGKISTMARSFLLNYRNGLETLSIQNQDSAGGFSEYPTTDELQIYQGEFRANAADKAILDNARSLSRANEPVLFCLDNSDTSLCRFMKILDANSSQYGRESLSKNRLSCNMREWGAGQR